MFDGIRKKMEQRKQEKIKENQKYLEERREREKEEIERERQRMEVNRLWKEGERERSRQRQLKEKEVTSRQEESLISEIDKYLTTINPIFILEPLVNKALIQALISRQRGGPVDITLPDDVLEVFDDYYKEINVFFVLLERKGIILTGKEKQFVDMFVNRISEKNYIILKNNEELLKGNTIKDVLFKYLEVFGVDGLYHTEHLDFLSNYLYKNKMTTSKLSLDSLVLKINEEKMEYQVNLLEKRTEESLNNNGSLSIYDIDKLTGVEFEFFLCDLFSKLGYTVKNTQITGDQGVDLLAYKNNQTLAIQAKCYNSSVGNSAIQQVLAGKQYYNAEKCMVITNSHFTSSAKELANRTGAILWDRDKLSEMINLTY